MSAVGVISTSTSDSVGLQPPTFNHQRSTKNANDQLGLAALEERFGFELYADGEPAGRNALTPEGRDRLDQSAWVYRLRDMEMEAGLERVLTIFVTRERGKRGRRNGCGVAGSTGADLPDERVAVFLGHRDVGEEHVDVLAAQHVERLNSRCCGQDVRLLTAQIFGDNRPALLVVVNDEYGDA